MEQIAGIIPYIGVGIATFGAVVLAGKAAVASRRGEDWQRVSHSTVPAVFLVLFGPLLFYIDTGMRLVGNVFTALAGAVGNVAALLIVLVGILLVCAVVWRLIVVPLGRLLARALTSA